MRPRARDGGTPLAPPPWLWLLLATYLWQLPSGVGWWRAQIRDLWTDRGAYGAEVVASPGFAALRVSTVSQLMPTLVLVAGLFTVVVPHVRGRYTRWRYRLTDATAFDDGTADATGQDTGQEGLAGLRQAALTCAPGTTLAVSMWGRSPPARVYATGWRERRIAVSLGFVALWRRSPDRARALLVHEVGHLDCGEHLIAGLGSPFTRAVQVWPLVFLASGVAPLVWLAARHEPTASLMWAQVVVVLSKATVVMVPVAALWCAELAADRYAVAVSGPTVVTQALDELRPPGRRHGFWNVTHPPMRLRRWCVERADRPVVPVLLTVAGPLALLAHAAVVTLLGGVALALAGDPLSAAVASSLELAHRDLLTVPLWAAVVCVVLVWPELAAAWLRLWRGRAGDAVVPDTTAGPGVFAVGHWTVRAAAVALPALVLAVALLPPSGAIDRDPVLRPSTATAEDTSHG
ncbi:M48 family metalloprotease [Streptomyces sp. NPDC046915]|uniref:M48 family metalloprotease n=1 Tax=Streptomyces sp. NPDC046915 TaxID=3155257 RepID=UPI0033D6F077